METEKRGSMNVYVPADGGLVQPDFHAEVKLVGPFVKISGDMIQNDNGRNQGYTDWVLYADQIEKVGK